MPLDTYPPLFGTLTRLPPSNIQAEQALLGALLANNRAFERVCSFLLPEHFADPIHGRIYQAISRRIQAGQLADAVTLKGEFENAGVLDDLGGVEYLAQLLTAMVGIINAGEYGRAIYDTWLRRQLIEVGETMVNGAMAGEPDVSAEGQVATAMEALLGLGDATATSSSTTGIGAAVSVALAEATVAHKDPNKRGLPTGIRCLDRMWRGLWPGSLDILGARAETGKTALGLQVAIAAAREFQHRGEGEHVLFFSLEMPHGDLGTRQLATMTGISADDIRGGEIGGARAQQLNVAEAEMIGLPLEIDDRSALTLAQIGLQARAMYRRKRVRLILIDHLHKIAPARDMLRTSRFEQIGHFTSGLKDLARSLKVPILLLAQLNRANEQREDHRPNKADLMYAGEADADNIVLLYRPELHLSPQPPKRGLNSTDEKHAKVVEYWHQERAEVAGVVEAIFAKRRAGPIGVVRMRFDGPRTRFYDPADQPAGQDPDLWSEQR